MMMKIFCMQGRGLCYKHSLGFPLLQQLPPSVFNLQTLHGFSKLGFALQGVCSFSSANPPYCTEWSGYSQFYQPKIEKTGVRNCWGVKSLCVKLLPLAVTSSAPLQASLHGPATVTLSITIMSPSCRMGCKCRRTSGAGAECPGSLLWNPKCGVLFPRWALPCPVTRCHLTGTHTRSTGTVLIQKHPHLEPGATSCPLWELLWREEEPSTSGRQQLSIYGRLSEEMKKFGEADKKFWGQITIQSETRNAWLICLFTLRSLQSASFQVDSCNFQWEKDFFF